MIGSTLHRYRDNQKYMGADVEATCLNLHFALPWQVCFTTFTNKENIKSESFYVKWPDLKISEDAAKITHFNKAKYEQEAIDPREALNIYENYLYNKDYEIVMQNGLGYDVYIHNNWRRALDLPNDFSYLDRFIDTNVLSKAIKKGFQPDLDNFLSWQYKVMNYKEKGLKTSLEHIGKELKIEHDYNNLHDARSDVDLMIKIFRKHLWSLEF